jgi:sporadic carbohydrate cluster protein (TIGR04323 family)
MKLRGYITSIAFLGNRVPQHIQNLAIREYCRKNNAHYLLSGTEYAVKGCYWILEDLLNQLKHIEGLVMYSLFQLPIEKNYRNKIYQVIISNKKSLHFAVENLKIENKEDCMRIENIWMVQIAMNLNE